MSNNTLSILKQAKDSKQIVSIYNDPFEPSMFLVGFIDQVDDTWVRMQAISPDGADAGYEIRDINSIFRINLNDNYSKKINLIRRNYPTIFREVELCFPIERDDIVLTTLKEAQEKELVVKLRTGEDDDPIIGYIDSVDEGVIRVLSVDDFGQEDGVVVLGLSHIVKVECNDRECQIIKFLNQNL